MSHMPTINALLLSTGTSVSTVLLVLVSLSLTVHTLCIDCAYTVCLYYSATGTSVSTTVLLVLVSLLQCYWY